MLLPKPGCEQVDILGRMGFDALRHVHQVRVAIDTLQLTGAKQALDDANVLRANFGPTKEPVFSTHDLVRSRIRISRAKGGSTKVYPLPRDLAGPIRKYLRKRTDPGPYSITGRTSNNQRGRTEPSVRKMFKYYASAAGLLANAASHSLRHSIAVHALAPQGISRTLFPSKTVTGLTTSNRPRRNPARQSGQVERL